MSTNDLLNANTYLKSLLFVSDSIWFNGTLPIVGYLKRNLLDVYSKYMIWFGLAWSDGISPIVGYLKPNLLDVYS